MSSIYDLINTIDGLMVEDDNTKLKSMLAGIVKNLIETKAENKEVQTLINKAENNLLKALKILTNNENQPDSE
jgi:hypothetical protein